MRVGKKVYFCSCVFYERHAFNALEGVGLLVIIVPAAFLLVVIVVIITVVCCRCRKKRVKENQRKEDAADEKKDQQYSRTLSSTSVWPVEDQRHTGAVV